MSRLPMHCLLGALVLTACGPKPPQGLTDQDKAAIRQAEVDFGEAMKSKDMAKATAGYTEDAVVMPPNGPAVTGRAAIGELMGSFPPITSLTLSVTDIDGLGNLAYDQGTYQMTLQLPNGASVADSGKFLEIRRRQADGTWLVSRDIWNSDVPEPAK